MPSWHTIFEIGLRTFPWKHVLGPLLFVAVGSLLFWVGSTSRAKWLGSRKTIYATLGAFIGSLALLMFMVLLVKLVPDFLALRHAYLIGDSAVVEGIIRNSQPAPALGPGNESFTVGDKTFSYNALDETPCFHDAPLHHGPIRNGLNVRIHYHDDCIQRIDVIDDAPAARAK